jgi:hypothetical protein
MSTFIYKDNEPLEHPEDKADIEEKLLALESGEKLHDRENYRHEVRNYQHYLVPFSVGEDGAQEVFKISSLYGVESIPIFLSESDYLVFQNDYLKKHGYIEKIDAKLDTLVVKAMTGKELFEIIPKSPLASFFVIFPKPEGLAFNFNLVEVFIDCFHEIPFEADLKILADSFETKTAKLKAQENPNLISAVKNSAHQEIARCQIFRKLFENSEWIVLISQPTKNKLLKGEVTRDDFDLDRYDNKRVVIFSDIQALDDYKNAMKQPEMKIYSIKVDSKRIFGSDLDKYDSLIVNAYSSNAAKIGKEHFKQLNELFAAFEIEGDLFHIDNVKKGLGHFEGNYYIHVKEFQNFILPLDTRSTNENLPSAKLPVYLSQDVLGNNTFPVFTARDCFQAFRFRELEKYNFDDLNFIEPYFIDGLRLFQILKSMKTQKIVFNHNGPVKLITFEPNFALQVYCA